VLAGAWRVKNSTWKEYGWKDEIKRDLRSTVFCVAVIIRSCHNRNKGTAENERLRTPKFIFSYPKNERLLFLGGRNAAQEEISTMRVG
jgi:hypothetical protein